MEMTTLFTMFCYFVNGTLSLVIMYTTYIYGKYMKYVYIYGTISIISYRIFTSLPSWIFGVDHGNAESIIYINRRQSPGTHTFNNLRCAVA